MRIIKKSDVILLCSLFLAGIVAIFILAIVFLGKGQAVVVRIDGEEYAKLPLDEDTELLIKSELGENLLIIKDGEAYVQSASCPLQVCVSTGKLSELSPIVCKHNHVSITLE